MPEYSYAEISMVFTKIPRINQPDQPQIHCIFFRNHSSDAQPPAPCAPRTKLSCTICNGTSVKGVPFFLGCYPRIMHIVPVYAIIEINWNSLSRTGVCGMSTVKN